MLRFNDSFQFLKKITPAKAANFSATLASYYWSRISKSPKHPALPVTIAIEPTTSCNLRCPECPSGLRSFTRDTGMLDKALFEKTVDALHEQLAYLYLYFQGEPYLHPQFHEITRYAAQKNIYTVTSSNAHFLNDENARATVESGLSRITISVDGITQSSYEQYRIGGNLEKVVEGTRRLTHWKQRLQSATPHVVFQFVAFSHNEHEIPELHRFAKMCGADDVKIKTAQVYDYENGNPLIPANKKYARYAQNEKGGYAIKNELLNHCWKLWHSCVITWDGKVVPCCFDKDAQYVMGDLKRQSFNEIWNGEAYLDFRRKLLRSRKEIDICRNCSEGTRVWV